MACGVRAATFGTGAGLPELLQQREATARELSVHHHHRVVRAIGLSVDSVSP
jgi:hypothetical protein